MYPEITARHQQLIDNVRTYAESYFSSSNVTRWRRDAGLPDEVVSAFVNLDFGPFNVIRRADNQPYDLFAQVLVLEELARSSACTLPFPNDFLNLQIMSEFAGSEQFERVYSDYSSQGRLTFALAISEPDGGSDTMSMQTYVKSEDGVPVLHGRKTFVNNGEFAPYLLVAAIDRDIPKGRHPSLSFWLVPAGLTGITVYPIKKIGQSMLPFSDVIFNGVKLDESYRLSGKVGGFPQLFHLFEIGRVFSCATALGMAQAAMEDAVRYARDRSAFGSSIGDFQIIRQMLVDMELKLQNMRNSVYRVSQLLSEGRNDKQTRLAVALMKRFVPATATEVASDALQIFGGRGYTYNERVASVWKDCRGYQIAEGTDQIMVHIAAPLVFDKYLSAEPIDSL
ncbi:acyl-CoA dehydrogenase [Eggerthellaceae bacterium zg-1084]|uniref:acyl-CoA dehydrogenase family protein n=1 Tax=Berryella wangjianweii TaxID=2734634 RepID=UPI00155667CE|nr:acyl-CoA dehydrogenase family protein [Berryella wangjianweii]NPD31537.1 acyl-CoA dehydrogenase [Berryella wangjianweii]NPD32968.1 acyl-CoA dehydrogenase [Eggerthellaceae bacterium zg-997]